MKQLLEPEFIERFLCANLSLFIIFGFIPAVRAILGIVGIGLCSFGLSFHVVSVIPSPSYFQAIKTGIFLSIPLLISYELITSASKSLEVLRGSQMAEQLFVQERGGPIEFGMFLFFGSLFFSSGGAEVLLSQFSTVPILLVDKGKGLQEGYLLVLTKVFPLAALSIVFELISGLIQRVSKKAFLGAESSLLRIPIAFLLLITLLEEY